MEAEVGLDGVDMLSVGVVALAPFVAPEAAVITGRSMEDRGLLAEAMGEHGLA